MLKTNGIGEMEMGMRLLFFCGSVTLAAATATAQTHTEQKPAQPATPSTGVVATVTATGCVERWSPEAGETATKAPDGVEYVLTHIEGRTASATTAGAPTPERTPPAARYLLLSEPKLNLGAHVNHRVRIDGTVAPQPTQGASLADNLTNPAARETNLPEGPEPKSYRDNLIDVSSLTMVAPACGK